MDSNIGGTIVGDLIECPACKGEGVDMDGFQCWRCKGSGEITNSAISKDNGHEYR